MAISVPGRGHYTEDQVTNLQKWSEIMDGSIS